MNDSMCVALAVTPEQAQRLQALQAAFAAVCNALAPLVQEHKCWNRVTLHHLAYKPLREQFPAMGSQMICNAIYSVSLTGRMVFQHPASPYHHAKLAGKRLPLLRFADTSPVYFDRHTLSLKGGALSMYTLDGRMRVDLMLNRKDELSFHNKKLREVVLSRRPDGVFELMFHFAPALEAPPPSRAASLQRRKGDIPSHVMVEVAA